MRLVVFILFLVFAGNCAYAQRPDLSIGLSGTMKILDGLESSQQYLSPGLDAHLHVSKRSLIAGTQFGYWTTMSTGSNDNFHHLHLDISAGFILIRRPAFKLILNIPVSNNFCLNSSQIIDNQLDFTKYSVLLSPELSIRYKFVLFGINYTAPVLGSAIRGPGVRLGCNF